jgi:MSHA pilin protein MshD
MSNSAARQRRRPRQAGFSLPEMILAIVVVGVGLAGVMLALATVARSSTDPLVDRQLLAIAEEMIEEIQQRPFTPAANAAPGGCSRQTFNDIADYDGYATTGQICSIAGVAMPALAGYSVAVQVRPATLGGIAAARRIQVDVSRGSSRLTLVGWRTDYAS